MHSSSGTVVGTVWKDPQRWLTQQSLALLKSPHGYASPKEGEEGAGKAESHLGRRLWLQMLTFV